jgi:hypothetical protein
VSSAALSALSFSPPTTVFASMTRMSEAITFRCVTRSVAVGVAAIAVMSDVYDAVRATVPARRSVSCAPAEPETKAAAASDNEPMSRTRFMTLLQI